MSSVPQNVSYSGTITRESPDIEAYKIGLLEAGQKLIAQPINVPAYQSAGLQGLQQSAIGLGKAYGDQGQGIGGYAPYLQGAGASLTGAGVGTARAMNEAANINVAPEFQLAQQGMGAAAQTAGQLGGLAQLAGVGYGNIAQGSQTIGQAKGALGDAYGTAQNISPFAQVMGAGYGDIARGGQTMNMAGQALTGSAQMYNPAQGIGAFMNPYTQSVIDESMKNINRQGDLARQNLAAQAVRTGAFGGTREGVQRAELERNLSDTRNSAIINALQQGYGQALQGSQQAFEAQQGRQMNVGQGLTNLGQTQAQQGLLGAQLAGQQAGLFAQQAGLQGQLAGQLAGIGGQQSQQGMLGAQLAGQQAGILGSQAGLYQNIAQGIGGLASQRASTDLSKAGTLGQLAGNLGNLGGQQAGLAGQAQALAQGDLNTYLALGGLQQQAAQQSLDAFRATETQKSMMPYQQLGFLSDLYRGAPSTSSAMTASSAPGTSPVLSAIGAGAAILGTAAGAKQAGLFG
jgi:hypothetical protein